jgi:hypothetical protein
MLRREWQMLSKGKLRNGCLTGIKFQLFKKDKNYIKLQAGGANIAEGTEHIVQNIKDLKCVKVNIY